ncbi:MAG: D-threitol dehydrogenase, partial [Friedmanniella sp.]|nr:D-threitol dehydrogenase [Friedmanniella sp.]
MLTPPVTDISSLSVNLDGTVAVVTGGASGIGTAVATLYARSGARVVILDRNLEAAQAVAAGLGGGAAAYEVDVTSPESVRSAVAAVLALTGRVDVLVNSAGVAILAP